MGGGGGGGRGGRGGRGGGGGAAGGGLTGATRDDQGAGGEFRGGHAHRGGELRNPAYPAEDFDRSKQQQLRALSQPRTEPTQLSAEVLQRHLSPYREGRSALSPGRRRSRSRRLKKVTLDDVKKFHDQFYGASHGVIGGGGPIDQAVVQKAAAELLGSWTSPAPYERLTGRLHEGGGDQPEDRDAGQGERAVRSGHAVPDVAERSGLSGHDAGELHVRRLDHGAHAESHTQSRRIELWRIHAAADSGGRRFRDAIPATVS